MTPYLQDPDVMLYHGDVLDVLREMEAESVDCVVTSPPYWGLRDYGTPGQFGLEPTPELYVERMVEVFREVRRVLASHGTVWINLGDSFHEKQLVGVPWRVAFALQADGWYLRSDIIWAKPNPMPESVTDRPTKAHEYVFLLSKQPRYFYDAEAIREPHSAGSATHPRSQYADAVNGPMYNGRIPATDRGDARRFTTTVRQYNSAGRNIRSVWEIDYTQDERCHWVGRIGFCRECDGLTVAGNGSDHTTAPATDASSSTTKSVAPTASPTSISSGLFQTDSPSTISAETKGASTPPISSPSPSGKTSTAATHQRLETAPRLTVHTDTNTLLRTLTSVLMEAGIVASVCECDAAASSPNSVWQIATQPFSGAHFATFPEELCRRAIAAGCPEQVCRVCLKARERIIDVSYDKSPAHGKGSIRGSRGATPSGTHLDGGYSNKKSVHGQPRVAKIVDTLGFTDCGHSDYRPGIALDPFVGSGTVCFVARKLGRRSIGIDLSAEYLELAARRLQQQSLFALDNGAERSPSAERTELEPVQRRGVKSRGRA